MFKHRTATRSAYHCILQDQLITVSYYITINYYDREIKHYTKI